ncbi:unnamed protein product [Calypogeia fissa]
MGKERVSQRVMAGDKKGQKRAMHPSNKYAEKPPDFSVLASKDPSFREYVTYGPNKRPRIDWTDFNATRELTRALLEHDYGIKWWIPDGQLCPTVPNRANYIHWIEDLLSHSPAPWHGENHTQIRGVDIGTGANCIYPLLGAALNGWHFVATDITPVAVEWARKNLQNNPHLSEGTEIRRAGVNAEIVTVSSSNISSCPITPVQNPHVNQSEGEDLTADVNKDHCLHNPPVHVDEEALPSRLGVEDEHTDPTCTLVHQDGQDHISSEEGLQAGSEDVGSDSGNAPLLNGVVKDCEKFDFCMCNPPFFNDMEEAGLNPRTACGGTVHEMVYPGGELAFITKMVEDSLQLRSKIHWYTSMVGRKVNIKLLSATLRARNVTMLRTTEFVQGRTSRWGIAWSFSPAQTQVASIPSRVLGKSNISFMLEGVDRKCGAWDILQALSEKLRQFGATVTVDTASFSITGTLSTEVDEFHAELPSKELQGDKDLPLPQSNTANKTALSFKASVFQQAPGSLVIKSSLSKTDGSSGAFSSLFERVELALKKQFLKNPSRS